MTCSGGSKINKKDLDNLLNGLELVNDRDFEPEFVEEFNKKIGGNMMYGPIINCLKKLPPDYADYDSDEEATNPDSQFKIGMAFKK